MKKLIKRQIFLTYLEIFSLTLLLMITFIMWENWSSRINFATAYAYNSTKAPLELDIENNLKPLEPRITKDNESYITINVTNTNRTKQNYNLYIKLDKNTQCEYIKVSLNKKEYTLNDLTSFTKGTYTYYLLNNNRIESNATNTTKIYLYLSENTPNNYQGKEINFTFNIEEM